MKALFVTTAMILSLFSCEMPRLPEYDIVENQLYEIPSKTQITQRIVFKTDSVSKDDLKIILEANFNALAKQTHKYHLSPTHIFIYAYKPNVDYKANGSGWVGMISRVMNENKGVQFKEGYGL